MALTKCSECGKDVSSQAAACPHCGCPITPAAIETAAKQLDAKKAQIEKKSNKGCFGCLGLVALICVIVWIGDMAGCNSNESTSQQETDDTTQRIMKAMGPDNPIAKHISSLSQKDAYGAGVTDGAHDVAQMSLAMHWAAYDYQDKLAEFRSLKSAFFDALGTQNRFDQQVFDDYRRGWDFGASTFSIKQ